MRTEGDRIEVRDALQRSVDRYHTSSTVTFPVRPPVHGIAEDVGGGFVRLHRDEGWIEVRLLHDGSGIEVRSAHGPMSVEPHSSNVVRVRIADDSDWSIANEPISPEPSS